MAEPIDSYLGRTLADSYLIERALGRGGMGAVYLARNVRTDGLVAIKLLQREAADNPEIFRRFQEEARIGSALRHPHIVQVIDFNHDAEGNPFIVMEYLAGEDLSQRLHQRKRLSLDDALSIARQVGSALQAAHDHGVVHRDIKPQNVFLVRAELAQGVTELAKVLDFGISKIRRSESQMTRDLTLLGTPQYMSPEAAQGKNSELDGRSDQFSLGVILYRALAGELPFDSSDLMAVLYQVVHVEAPPLRQLAPTLPAHVALAVERGMAKRREDRFPSMRDFLRALEVPGSVFSHSPTGAGDGNRAPIDPSESKWSTLAPPSASSLSLATGQPHAPPHRNPALPRVATALTLLCGGAVTLTYAMWPKSSQVQRLHHTMPDLQPRASAVVDMAERRDATASAEQVLTTNANPAATTDPPTDLALTKKKSAGKRPGVDKGDLSKRKPASPQKSKLPGDDDDAPVFPAHRAK